MKLRHELEATSKYSPRLSRKRNIDLEVKIKNARQFEFINISDERRAGQSLADNGFLEFLETSKAQLQSRNAVPGSKMCVLAKGQ